MRTINENDIRAILYGTCFLGAGGGGCLSDGLAILDDNIKKHGNLEVNVIEPDEIGPAGSAVMIAGMGAPTVLKTKEEKFRYEVAYTFDAMKCAAQFSGKNIEAIIPVEYGPVNYIVPMIACIERNMPLVDADGCGRAVPGLDTTLFNINKIPFCPAVACDDKNNVVYLYTHDAADGTTAEEVFRHLCGAFGYVMGLGGWISSPSDIKEKLILGTLTKAEKVGKAILRAKEGGIDVFEELKKEIEIKPLVTGTVVKLESVMHESHDIGVTEILGDDGEHYFVDVKNESILFRHGDDAVITCPDLICVIDEKTGDPQTNADMYEGQRVKYFAVPAPEIWFSTSEIQKLWKPYFEAVGYQGGIVRY